jgi:hypothetical protein
MGGIQLKRLKDSQFSMHSLGEANHLNRAVLMFKSLITNLPHRYRCGSGNSFPLGSESCTSCTPIQASNIQYTEVRGS